MQQHQSRILPRGEQTTAADAPGGHVRRRTTLLAVLLMTAATTATAARVIPLYDGPSGVTREYFNRGARVAWKNNLGDWIDATGKAQGDAPFAEAPVQDSDESRAIEWNVTTLVQGWTDARFPNSGIYLRSTGPRGGSASFYSREADDADHRPALIVQMADGRTLRLGASADASLDGSTVRPLGGRPALTAGGSRRAVMRFELEKITGGRIAQATLRLVTTQRQAGSTTLGVYRLDAPTFPEPGTKLMGLAARYPGDRGLEKDPDVIMVTGFESAGWRDEWTDVVGGVSVVSDDRSLRFEPLSGKALRVELQKGALTALNTTYDFKPKVGSEPEEIYFRYYLRFAESWNPTVQGGKLPGPSGTYGKAGWGGRKVNGSDGWSMRGLFLEATEPANPLSRYTSVGTYAYHVDMRDHWGDNWPWMIGQRGLLENNRWYCIEQYFRVNTPGQKDGALKVWVDGELAFERAGLRVRNVPDLKIQRIWMNVYHGGSKPSHKDQHLFIDNVVVARKYIGPMSAK
jgi:hypothetical protein